MDEPRKIRVGIIGQAFMGKIHANAYIKIRYSSAERNVFPILAAMAGRNIELLKKTAAAFGVENIYGDWKDLISSEKVDVIDNCGPDPLHYDVVMAALEAGIPVISEKPLAVTLEECRAIALAAKQSHLTHMTCFNYRFLPAVRLAKTIIEQGRLGDIYHMRSRYYQSPGMSPSTPADQVWYFRDNRVGILQGIGCHAIDLMQYLVGPISEVSALMKNFTPTRYLSDQKEVTTDKDELTLSLVQFSSGALGTMEASGISGGNKNRNEFEIYGTKGALHFDLEDLNYLDVYLPEEQGRDIQGFTKISVTEAYHPLGCSFLPRGHILGWEYGHVFALEHFLTCVAQGRSVQPEGADLVDGYRVERVMEAMKLSHAQHRRVVIDKEIAW